jgi:hypothetical protein
MLDPECAKWLNKIERFPDKVIKIKFKKVLTEADVRKFERPIIPRSMDDKWFCYKNAEFLDFHRSWTGHHIYRLRLVQESHGYSVQDLLVNGNRKQYNRRHWVSLMSRSLIDCKTISYLVEAWIKNDGS